MREEPMSEVSLQPAQSVEVWSSYVHTNGTTYYALLNRNANYRAEVWQRLPNGTAARLWASDSRFKYASVSISPAGRSLVVVYSRSSGPDSKTPYRPYMQMLENVLP
jgi:hypothetical protein